MDNHLATDWWCCVSDYHKTYYSRSVKIYRFVCIKNFGAKIPHRYLAHNALLSYTGTRLCMHYICLFRNAMCPFEFQAPGCVQQCIDSGKYGNGIGINGKKSHKQTIYPYWFVAVKMCSRFSPPCCLCSAFRWGHSSQYQLSILLTCYKSQLQEPKSKRTKLSRVTILFRSSHIEILRCDELYGLLAPKSRRTEICKQFSVAMVSN